MVQRLAEVNERLKRFLIPELNRKTLIRVAVVAAVTYVFFAHVLRPVVVRGYSMEPTYVTGGVNFCWKLRYLFSEPQRGDIVLVRLGSRVMYLKRVLATAGDTIEFRDGKLYLNGQEQEEPYVKLRGGHWNFGPRVIGEDEVFVSGDNRSVLYDEMRHGVTDNWRIQGAPLW